MNEKKTIYTYDVLNEKLKNLITNKDELESIHAAFLFAFNAHKERTRLNNDSYISHPLSVAYILADLNVDYITIMGALLHETINHADVTIDDIEKEFGTEVAKIVTSISKINKLELADDKESSAIYLRKVLVGLSEDVRVLFIKLADRLHNMRTIWALAPEEQKRKANETMSVLIPIAHRLGINSISSELEDLCLKYTKPDVYNDILEKLDASYLELNRYLNDMKESISEILGEAQIKFKIKGRVKSVHSLYNKISNGKKWENIYDILALRVFVEKESDCYLTIGLIHSKFRPMPKRFKDYIAMPKENMYQSLHTTVFGVEGQIFEVQVRTYEMDEIAEKGIAAHWSYKEKGKERIQNIMEQKLEMFRNVIDANNETTNDTEFAENLRTEFLTNLIYCFTPKGDVVELPSEATPIDFAYRIHSKVGDTTVGALVNDTIVPLDYKLQDGDIVKINTNLNSTPNKDWLNFVKTSQAKNKIKSFFSKQDHNTYVLKGQDLLEKEIRKRKLAINEVLSQDNIKKVTTDLKLSDLEDLYLSIGSLRFTPSYIINLIYEDKKDVQDILLEKVFNRGPSKIANNKNDVIVSGIDEILISLAKCCSPVKGDAIKGYITKGDGIVVHRADCPNILESDRLIDVSWNNDTESSFITTIEIEGIHTNNHLFDIIQIATKRNIYIDSVNSKELDSALNYVLNVKTKNTEELELFISDLKSLAFVRNVKRRTR